MKSGAAAVTTAVIMLVLGIFSLVGSIGGEGNDFSLFGVIFSSLLIIFTILTFIFVHKKKYHELFFMIFFMVIASAILAFTVFAGIAFTAIESEILQELFDLVGYFIFVFGGVFGLVPFIFSIVYFALRGKEKRALQVRGDASEDFVFRKVQVTPPLGTSHRSLEDQLIELRNLFNQGLITAEEFERKRQELLSRY